MSSITDGIARIVLPDNSHVGMGIVIDEWYLITCCHVVADAIGLSRDLAEPPIQPLAVVFPYSKLAVTRTAQVVREAWRHDVDLALLKLDAPAPADVGDTTFDFRDSWLDVEVRIYGTLPSGNDGYAIGKTEGIRSDGTVQLVIPTFRGQQVDCGFSGSGVWGKQEEAVVGMVVSKNSDDSKGLAYFLPSNKIRDVLQAYEALLNNVEVPSGSTWTSDSLSTEIRTMAHTDRESSLKRALSSISLSELILRDRGVCMELTLLDLNIGARAELITYAKELLESSGSDQMALQLGDVDRYQAMANFASDLYREAGKLGAAAVAALCAATYLGNATSVKALTHFSNLVIKYGNPNMILSPKDNKHV